MSVFLSLAPVPELHLPRAPLAKVIAQVQFSRTPALVSGEAEVTLAELLPRYPVRRQGPVGLAFALSPVGMPAFPQLPPTPPPAMRLFSEPTNSWQVTLTETSVALETTQYESRDDLCGRIQQVLTAVAAVAVPPVVDRVGLRYISRLTGDHLTRINDYVVPQLGVLQGAAEEGLSIGHCVSDTLVHVADNERMQARSGILPPNVVFDSSLLPLAEPSWLLDLDVFTVVGGFAFDPLILTAQLRRFSEHAYSFFRFATTEEFQAEFGERTPAQDDRS